jgi:2-oxoglutarate dehydrogenase complex dehydrogenase (E1) component-like enzyme
MALNAKANPNYVPKRINGKFAPGWSGNPGGSLEATRRSFNKDFLLALAADFKKHGAAAIEKVRKTQPAAYMKICALLVPREMQIERSGTIKQMSDEQIEEAIAAIRAMLDVRADDAAQVIEGEAEVVPSLPAPARPTKAS